MLFTMSAVAIPTKYAEMNQTFFVIGPAWAGKAGHRDYYIGF